MRVVLEVNSVLQERHSGVFTYGAGLLQGMAELAERPEVVLFCPKRNWINSNWLGDLPERLAAGRAGSGLKARQLMGLWRYLHFPAMQYWAGDFDVYHSLHQLMPPARGRARLLTVHDLRRYRHPEFYPHSKLEPFARAVRQADHFICISQATKKDLQEFFAIRDEKIDVVYHGGALGPLPMDGAQKRAGGEAGVKPSSLPAGRYFVAFSSYDRRKNLPNIMRAFVLAKRELPGFKLLIVGREPADTEYQRIRAEAGADVIACGPVDDFLPLLTKAAALVYASLYEGFGLPILEAFAAGTAVITSNVSSMPEVAGAAGLLVDPRQPESIAAGLRAIGQDAGKREELIAAGRRRMREFSWERAAEETVRVYEKFR